MPNTGLGAMIGRSLGSGLLCLLFGTGPTAALEDQPADWDSVKACEQEICGMLLTPTPKGTDLKCALAKTWAKTTLKGGESKMVKWGFGDARCLVDLNLTRGALASAMTEPSYSLEVPEHKVNCEVERDGEIKKVKVKLAPRIDFKNGKADKVWINLKDVSGPTSIKTTVWAAANLEDSFGIFHKSMIKSINRFVYKRCPEHYGPNAIQEEASQDKKHTNKKDEAPKPVASEGAVKPASPNSDDATAKHPDPAQAPKQSAVTPAPRPAAPAAATSAKQ